MLGGLSELDQISALARLDVTSSGARKSPFPCPPYHEYVKLRGRMNVMPSAERKPGRHVGVNSGRDLELVFFMREGLGIEEVGADHLLLPRLNGVTVDSGWGLGAYEALRNLQYDLINQSINQSIGVTFDRTFLM